MSLSLVLSWLASVLAVLGALSFLVSAVAVLRVRDAVSRVNSMGPATAVGIPFILLAVLIEHSLAHGWSWMHAVEVLLAIVGAVVVSSVGSNALGRAAYRSGAPIDPTTDPNELSGR
ncbi:MAG: monovalent cation/H(+) antiporter subunit G [Tetrasphaera sp.]|nr:monovalent cation/H(+) antiporter subunit G [Tetrasphaera sp.]